MYSHQTRKGSFMIENPILQVPIKISKKHVIKNAKNNNMDFEEAICEFIDNSIDAKATQVDIFKKKSDIDKHFHFTFIDNGNGMSHESLISAVSSYGSKGNYDNSSIGMYGVGLKDAVSNLCEKGIVRIESVKDGFLSVAEMSFDDDDLDGDAHWNIYPVKSTKKKNGTSIFIPNVKNTTHNQPLLNFLSTTYYPRWKKDKNFKIVFHYNDDKLLNIVMEDPLYYDLMVKNGYEAHQRSLKIDGETISIYGFCYPDNCPQVEDYVAFDKKVGNSTEGPHSARRAGTFWNIGNRFSSLGNGIWHFMLSDQQILNSCRVCVIVPKKLQHYFVQINKSKINIDGSDETLKDFIVKYKEVVASVRREASKKSKDNPNTNEIEKHINDALRPFQKDKPVDMKNLDLAEMINNISFKSNTGKGGSNNRPTGLAYEKTRPFIVEIKSFDSKRQLMSYDIKPNGQVVITLNDIHEYYKNYFLFLDAREQAIQVISLYCMLVTLISMQHLEYFKPFVIDEFMDMYSKKLNEYHQSIEA